ncbi:MAG: IS1380 family transposase [Candidatus Dormibacteria bacterium]
MRRGRGERERAARRRLARRLAREQRLIGRRLEAAVAPNDRGPVLGRANVVYEMSQRSRATVHGGMGLIAELAGSVDLAGEIDSSLQLLQVHRPYFESDHVLNIAYNILCGGKSLDDIELRRTDRVFLDALGAAALPDPTTAGDFCRRFDETSVMALQAAVNRARLKVWSRQDKSFLDQTARIDADATIVGTDAETKAGMDIAYNGIWGYSALVVSLANTAEPLFLGLHGANRPSHEGAVALYDAAVALCRQAGYRDILLRGDSDYSLTSQFDRWDGDGIRFVFGYDARANLVKRAQDQPDDLYRELAARAERQIATKARTRPAKVKDGIVRQRGYKTIRPKTEEVVEFDYRPGKCTKDYRVVALRKNLSIERGDNVLFDEHRFFFYITNDRRMSAEQVVAEARNRCNQENLHAQLKGAMRALHAPVNTLVANWAYMTMASLAWSLKAWCALLLPVNGRWADQHLKQRRALLAMEFRTFRQAFIEIPCQIIRHARQVRWRVLTWNPWLGAFFRLAGAI